MSILQILDYTGSAVFAVSGALAAGRKSLDLLGVVVIAWVTATGGGTVRDLLLDHRPIFWIGDPAYLLVIVAAALLTMPYTRFRRPPLLTLQIADGLGLAFFSISGAQVAEAAGQPGAIVVVMATITAVFGGVLRDVLCNDIPMILRKGSIYGTAVIAGAGTYVLIGELGAPRWVATLTGMSAVAGLRFAAIVWDLSLPVFSLPPGPDDHLPPPRDRD